MLVNVQFTLAVIAVVPFQSSAKLSVRLPIGYSTRWRDFEPVGPYFLTQECSKEGTSLPPGIAEISISMCSALVTIKRILIP